MIYIIESISKELIKIFSKPYLDGYSENAIDYYMGLTGGEYPELNQLFIEHKLDYKELFSEIKDTYGEINRVEWKSPNGDINNFNIHYDFSRVPVKFVSRAVKTGAGFGAVCSGTKHGIEIVCRPQKLSKQIIYHELAHGLQFICGDITEALSDTDIFGNYNLRLNKYIGNFGNVSAEESWADCVSCYLCNGVELKNKYPRCYRAIELFFNASPTALDFILDNYEIYSDIYKSAKDWEVWVD